MSIFNPWGELRALKARLAAEEEAYLIEEAQQQADRAKKDALMLRLDAMMLELERKNATLRRANEKLRDQLKKANDRIEYLYKLSEKNSSLYATETHRSAKLAATLKEQDALVVMLHEKLAQAVDPRDPKTGRFTKKVK